MRTPRTTGTSTTTLITAPLAIFLTVTAAAAPAATMNGFLQQAADDLRSSSHSGSGTAISELTYLAHLPATSDMATQQAQARSDVQALDSFFGTPGLLS